VFACLAHEFNENAMYDKTIIAFGFDDIQSYQDLGERHQCHLRRD
jgi:uncharacterized caspase-like protein